MKKAKKLKIKCAAIMRSDEVVVDRKEAARIAFEAGQILKSVTVLFSEDLTGEWPWEKK